MTKPQALLDENQILDSAIKTAAPELAHSLQQEELQRRRRTRRQIGVSVMLIATGIVAVLVFTNPGSQPDTGATSVTPTSSSLESLERSDSFQQQGWAAFQANDFEAARRAFEQAVTLDPESADGWNGLGWSRFRSGVDNAEAIASFEKALTLQPDYGAALNGLGQIAYFKRDYPEARRFFEKAPHAPAAQVGLAQTAMLQGDFETARDTIEKILPTYLPQGADLKGLPADQHAVAKLLIRLRDAAAAGQIPDALRRTIEPPTPAKNQDAAAITAKGWQLWQARKLRSAEAHFQEALALDPDYAAALNGLGWTLLNQGKHAEAEPLFTRLTVQQPEHGGALNGLARCQKQRGDIEAAIATWKKGLGDAPQPNALASGLATTYYELKRYDEALPLLEILVEAGFSDQASYAKMLEQARSALNP